MTAVRIRQHRAVPAHLSVADDMHTSGLQVGDDMTVEVALSLMTGARVGHLLLCDDDHQCTGSVTWAQLAAFRDGPTYTDRVRLRDVLPR